MELPKIEEIFPRKKSSLFMAIKIEANEVKSAIWSFEDGKVETLALGDHQEWAENKEELLVACDASIASAVTRLKDESKRIPHELILGLPSSWIQDSKVSPQRLADLHFITRKLSLSPIGFVVNPEAITHALKNKEKDLPTVILVYFGTKEIGVSLVEDGKLIQSESVGRSDNLVLDVEEGILRFSSKNLPSRILLYNSEDLEEARQTLISYPWQSPLESGKPGFLHLPRVEILPADFDIEAIVFAGGEEIKKSRPVASRTEHPPEEGKMAEEVTTTEAPTITAAAREKLSEEIRKEEIEFVKGEDILEQLPVETKAEEKAEAKSEIVLEEKAIGRPVVALSPTGQEIAPKKKISLPRIRGFTNTFLKIPSFFRKFFEKIPKFSQITLTGSPSFLKFLFAGTFAIFAFALGSFYFLATARVTLRIEPNIINKEFSFKVDSEIENVDVVKRILPAKLLSAEIKGEKTAVATGRKTVGEKAKGEVVIYNRTDQPKRFAAGIALFGPGRLRFVLDAEVKVASKSPDLALGIDRWGEIKAAVSAAEIGAQYNLATNSQFTFEDLPTSSFLAKNLVAFLGGTSRQITIVSKEDQEKLSAELTKDFNKRGRVELEKKIEVGESLIPETIKSQVKTEEFDREVQEEASGFSLKLTVENEALAYRRDDLMELLASLLTSDQLSSLEIEKEKTEISVSPVVGEDDLVFNAKAKIALKEKINTQDLALKIKGKTRWAANTVLSKIKSVKLVQIEIVPGFFAFLGRLPFKVENIKVEVRTD